MNLLLNLIILLINLTVVFGDNHTLALNLNNSCEIYDDFNQPDGDPSSDWSPISGTWSIVDEQLFSKGDHKVMKHTTVNMTNYVDFRVSMDVLQGAIKYQYKAICIGYGGSRCVFIQLSASAGSDVFNRLTFRSTAFTSGLTWDSNNPSSRSTIGYTSARVTYYFSNNDTVAVEIDVDFDGVADKTYTRDGVLSIADNLGTGLVVQATGSTGYFDNFCVEGEFMMKKKNN